MKLWRDNQIPGNKSKAKGTALGGRGDNINVDIRKSEAGIEWMEEFLLKQPTPVLKIEKEGVITYSNEAGKPLIEEWGSIPAGKSL
jgi:hypothetical protein